MSENEKTGGCQQIDPVEEIYSEIVPYLANPEMVREKIVEALLSPDPEDYLIKEIRESPGSLSMDLRIALNRMGKKCR